MAKRPQGWVQLVRTTPRPATEDRGGSCSSPRPHGEGGEEARERASHALPSVDDEPTLCAEAHHPLSHSRWLLGGAARGGEHRRRLWVVTAVVLREKQSNGLGHNTLCLLLAAATVATWGG
jgi:hypothetical protein